MIFTSPSERTAKPCTPVYMRIALKDTKLTNFDTNDPCVDFGKEKKVHQRTKKTTKAPKEQRTKSKYFRGSSKKNVSIKNIHINVEAILFPSGLC